jgi:hypothetical protein
MSEAGKLGYILVHRLFLPFGLRWRCHRSTSPRLQTGVARRRAIGSGKLGSLVSRIACRRVTWSTSATSARPARLSFRFTAIASKMMSQSKRGGTAQTARPRSQGGSP